MNRRKNVFWLAIAFMTLIAGVTMAATTQPPQGTQPVMLDIGASAPDFSLPGVDPLKGEVSTPAKPAADGRNYKLSDFAEANVLMVVFTANHCPTAQAYEDRIKQIAADYKGKGVAVVAISCNDPLSVRLDELGYTDLGDSFEEMKVRADEHKFNFPYLYDGKTQSVSLAYGPVSTPHVFIFDKERKLQYTGAIDNSEDPGKVKKSVARDAIEALLEGREVTVKKVKPFGCSVKWADKRASVQKGLADWAKEPVSVNVIEINGVREIMKNNSPSTGSGPSGKLRLLNVWATWCGPCVIEMPELVNINRMYRARAFEMVTISADMSDKKDAVQAFLKDKQVSCTNYLIKSDDKSEFVDAVDKDWQGAIPYTVIIKPGGEIIYRHTGPIDPLEVKKVIIGYLGRYYF